MFSDDENSEEEEGESGGIGVLETEGEGDEAGMVQTRQTSSKRLTSSRIRVCKTPATTTAARNVRTASKVSPASSCFFDHNNICASQDVPDSRGCRCFARGT